MANKRGGGGRSYVPLVDTTRVFFECAECGYYHESVLQLDCRMLTNRFLLGQVPVGGPTATEVHYLDGHIERMPADVLS